MLLFALFGIMSFWAPSAMMELTASLGMETVSGDYAFQEYERSGSVSCLARSFLIASQHKDDRNAEQRFMLLYGTDEEGNAARERFEEFCGKQDASAPEGVPAASYRSFLCAQAAAVKYRLAKTAEEKCAVCDFAIGETEKSFRPGNPVISLAVCIAEAKDVQSSAFLLTKMMEKDFEENTDFINIMNILLEVHE